MRLGAMMLSAVVLAAALAASSPASARSHVWWSELRHHRSALSRGVPRHGYLPKTARSFSPHRSHRRRCRNWLSSRPA